MIKNFLLITSEDNGQHFSCYGDPYIQTPNLDRLASEGACFENAYCTQAVCSPGRASILTGLYPHQNGQIGLATHRFSMFREFPTIPSILKQQGFRTGRIGKLHVLPESASPFDMVWNDGAYHSFGHRDVRKTAAVAGEFIRDNDQPFFLMCNYTDAHLPWLRQDCGLPEKPFTASDVKVPEGVGFDTGRLRNQAADYYSCLSRLDLGIGMLLDELEQTGKLDETLIVFVTDHGPQFSRGKCATYELATRIPMIVRWPGMPAQGMVHDKLVSQIDVLPTVLDALDIDPIDVAGESLRGLVAGESCEWRDHIFTEWTSSHPYPPPTVVFPQRAVRDSRHKLIMSMRDDIDNPVERYYTERCLVDSGVSQWEIDHAEDDQIRKAYETWRRPGPLELYDLQEDPWEFNNLIDDPAYADIRDELLLTLRNWQQDTNDQLADSENLQKLIVEHEHLHALRGAHKQEGFRWEYLDYLKP